MFDLAPSRKIILGIMVFSLVSMLAVSLVQRLQGDPLVVQGADPNVAELVENNAAATIMQEIGKHMEELKENPDNFDLLVHTADLLLQTEQWDAAESFLRRALTLDASKAQPHYLLGIALHSNEKHAEAAASLERVVSINNDPSARYSLGVLYAYYLEDKARALDHFAKALEMKDLGSDLRTAIEMESEKVRQESTSKP